MIVKNLRDERGPLANNFNPKHFFLFQPSEGDRGKKPSVLNALKVE